MGAQHTDERRDRAYDGADPRVPERLALERRVHGGVEHEVDDGQRGGDRVAAHAEHAAAGDERCERETDGVRAREAAHQRTRLRARHLRVEVHFEQLVHRVRRRRREHRAQSAVDERSEMLPERCGRHPEPSHRSHRHQSCNMVDRYSD